MTTTEDFRGTQFSHRRGVKSKIKVVMMKPAQMDIAAHHFTAQNQHNGVNPSADLHLKGALQKRSCESALNPCPDPCIESLH
jgi:hypothetical protein